MLFVSKTEHDHFEQLFSVMWRLTSETAYEALYRMAAYGKAYRFPILQLEKYLGYGLTQAFTSGEDVAYKACMNVSRAAIAHLQKLGAGRNHPSSSMC